MGQLPSSPKVPCWTMRPTSITTIRSVSRRVQTVRDLQNRHARDGVDRLLDTALRLVVQCRSLARRAAAGPACAAARGPGPHAAAGRRRHCRRARGGRCRNPAQRSDQQTAFGAHACATTRDAGRPSDIPGRSLSMSSSSLPHGDECRQEESSPFPGRQATVNLLHDSSSRGSFHMFHLG